MSLLAVGTITFDTIETPTESRQRILGGSATYFSYAASFFGPVRLLGIVGKDWPDRYSQLLLERGIDLAGLVRDCEKDSYYWHGWPGGGLLGYLAKQPNVDLRTMRKPLQY